jgi:hypothetical protein
MAGHLTLTVRAARFLAAIIKMQTVAIAEDRAVTRKGALPTAIELHDDALVPWFMKAQISPFGLRDEGPIEKGLKPTPEFNDLPGEQG